jgi:hypothetical protein
MNNYPKRTNTKHWLRLVIKVTALGVGALAWAVFGQQESTPSGDDKTAGRDRVDKTAGRDRVSEGAEPLKAMPNAIHSSSASPIPAKKSETKSQSTERKEESAQPSPTPTPRASASPK